MRLSELRQANKQAIVRAGPRYAPGQDRTAPNLEIASITQAFDAIGLTADFRARVAALRADVQKAWNDVPRRVRRSFRRAVNNPDRLLSTLAVLQETAPTGAGAAAKGVHRAAVRVDRAARRLLEQLRQAQQGFPRESEEYRALDYQSYRTQELAAAVRAVVEFAETPSFGLMGANRLLLLGEWGTGKTHSLCDLTERRMNQGLPTVLCLGQQLPDGVEPIEGVCRATGVANTPRRLLQSLQRMGLQRNGRAILIVDAINEGDRGAWKRALASICRNLARYPNVGLVLSCRQPFERQIFTTRTARQFVTVRHQGFAEKEFDAQLSFFEYYEIPAPHFPLITPEFSRPLFLQLLCKAIANLSQSGKHRQIRHFASGQRGMTYMLESFVKHVGQTIEDEVGLSRGTCWRILKGDSVVSRGQIPGIAPAMASQLRDDLTRDECLDAIQPFLDGPRKRARARRLLQRMLADGLLSEDIRWVDDGYIEVVRFPYQRFGDHVVARHLLRQHLKANTIGALRRSFYRNRPLGQVFELMPGATTFKMPGFASAIMLEFPERVQRHVPEDERELVFYLPRDRQLLTPFANAFLEGLPWRSVQSFTPQTGRLVNALLERSSIDFRNEVVEVLVGLATREGHVFSAERLHRYLADMEMVERDAFWTEYLRLASDTSVVFRLLEWVERNVSSILTVGAATVSVRLLSLVLTTTRRPLRDRATRALFLVGLRHPQVLFENTLSFLSFNDPYVPERLLAACYGVAMSLWADPSGAPMRAVLTAFAQSLAAEMFVPPSHRGTRHALMRDYALGTILLARQLDPDLIPAQQLRFLRRPFAHLPVPFNPAGVLTDRERAETEPALHMDFDNYTLGHLVPGRQNYDSNHPDYQLVRNQLLGRMRQLGYSHALFQHADDIIGRSSWFSRASNGNKTDRYGKKYSWIAYFELYGYRHDQGLLSASDGERPSDCDIDPSFPLRAPTWQPRVPDVFTGTPTDPLRWLREGPRPRYDHLLERQMVDGVRGPWVLLDGYINQKSEPHEVFTFLRGLLVSPRNIDRLRRTFDATDYPGNRAIPEPYEDHYTFGGEIPWAQNFGSGLRRRDGRARRNIQSAFDSWALGRRRRGIPIEVPGHEFSWESYHSTVNQSVGGRVPAPALCEALGLVNHARRLDLYDGTGRPSSLCRRFGEESTSGGSLLFIRRSLMRRYLRQTDQRLVWMVWGERNFTAQSGLHDQADIRAAWGEYPHIHKHFTASP